MAKGVEPIIYTPEADIVPTVKSLKYII